MLSVHVLGAPTQTGGIREHCLEEVTSRLRQQDGGGRRRGPGAEGEEARERRAQGTGGDSGAHLTGQGQQCGQSIVRARAAQGDETGLCPEGGVSLCQAYDCTLEVTLPP